MKQITEDYVSFEVAKLLKEKGFDEPIKTYYFLYKKGEFFEETDILHTYNNDAYYNWSNNQVAAPTHQMAMKWLRQVYKIFITISVRFSNNADDDINFSYLIKDHNKHTEYDDGEFISYEDACEAAIKYCLTNIL